MGYRIVKGDDVVDAVNNFEFGCGAADALGYFDAVLYFGIELWKFAVFLGSTSTNEIEGCFAGGGNEFPIPNGERFGFIRSSGCNGFQSRNGFHEFLSVVGESEE